MTDRWTTDRTRTLLGAVAAWNLLDLAVHVLVDRVEAARVAGNLAALVAAGVAVVAWRSGRAGLAALACGLGTGLVLGVNLAWVAANGELPPAAAVFIGVSIALLAWAGWCLLGETATAPDHRRSRRWTAGTLAAGGVVAAAAFLGGFFQSASRQLHDDRLVAADYWDTELRILSAGMGFDNIIGVPDSGLETTREAMGSWWAEPDCAGADGPLSTVVEAQGLTLVSQGFTDFDDGLPIVTTWPVLTSTVHPEDFLFTLNDGSQVVPHAATMTPNWELNERNTIVVFGDFGNRGRAGEADQLFPVELEIVDDGTPLTFVGPDGPESGVGLTWQTDTSPYDRGPSLVGAKLNRIGDEPVGEGGVGLLEAQMLPNDEFALFGGGDFKVRILTTGGFSPDGMRGIRPDQFGDFFRLHATGVDGEVVLLTETGVDYELAGGTLRIVGMSDLGEPAGDGIVYDDCYVEDSDNYIDIVLVGDEAAARSLTFLEIPAGADGYEQLYNPGGPGPEPFPDIRYTAPGPPDLEPIIMALDDPMRVSWDG